MSSETAYLALLLDGPLQSWGFASRFQRRTTGLHPTKSGVVGLICAAMGLAKGSPDERVTLPNLANAEDDQHRHPACECRAPTRPSCRCAAWRITTPCSTRVGPVER